MCVGMYMWIQCPQGPQEGVEFSTVRVIGSYQTSDVGFESQSWVFYKSSLSSLSLGPLSNWPLCIKKNIIPVHSSSLILHCFHLHSRLTPMSGGPGSDSILINKPGWEVSEAEGECFDIALLLWVSCSSVPSSLWIQAGETVPSLNTAVNRRCPWQTSTRGSKALLGNSIHPVCSHFISEGSHKARADVKAWIDDV